MKKIEATIAPSQIDAITDALYREGDYSITVSDVQTSPLQRGQLATYRGVKYEVKFVQGAKLEILLDDFEVAKVVALIRMMARSVGPADGQIFVLPVNDAIRIHSGEHGRAASLVARG